jgi:monothiol glutaredoxin
VSLDEPTRDRIRSLIDASEVLLFMKGTREAPQCGFSATVVALLDRFVPDYATFDVLGDPALREGIKEYSSWPTIPQLYVRGELVGGCDIVRELYETGELAATLGLASEAAPETPHIGLSDAAAEAMRAALAEAPAGHVIQLAVDARWRARLLLGPPEPGMLRAESGDVAVHVDPTSASRARDASIDLVRMAGHGTGFQVHLPRAPADA